MLADTRRAIAAPYAWKGADLETSTQWWRDVPRSRTHRTLVLVQGRESIA